MPNKVGWLCRKDDIKRPSRGYVESTDLRSSEQTLLRILDSK